jgi:hypothetical protein
MKIIISMTSWTKRINYVGEFIYTFLTSQTIKPDIFYLWLAEEEFPNKEKDLPEDLLSVCKYFKVEICWTKENEGPFKRYYTFFKHYNDMVILLDDDITNDPNTIKAVLAKYKENPIPQVIHYCGCGGKITIKNEIEYTIGSKPIMPYHITNYFMARSAFTPKSFPLEAFTKEMIELRKKICPLCDESWIHPFLIKNNIPITFIFKLKWHENKEIQNVAIKNILHTNVVKIDGKKYKRADIYKFIVLKSLPELQDSWKKAFPNYNFNYFNLSALELLDIISK